MNEQDLAQVTKCACANLRAVTRVVTQAFDKILEPSGLTTAQFTLLSALANFGPATISHLAEKLLMDATTLNRNLKPLEKQQLVASNTGEDQRTRYVSLTEAGLQALHQALPLWNIAQSNITEQLGQEKFETFLKDLYLIADLVK